MRVVVFFLFLSFIVAKKYAIHSDKRPTEKETFNNKIVGHLLFKEPSPWNQFDTKKKAEEWLNKRYFTENIQIYEMDEINVVQQETGKLQTTHVHVDKEIPTFKFKIK